MNEPTIIKLLDGDVDPTLLREELLDIGRRTAWEPFLEIHHVEPERVEEINLTPLQHLAIHICIALITPTRSNYAKVLAFVKPFPGGWCRIISLETVGLTERLVSFGQKGGDAARMNAHPNTLRRLANRTQRQRAQAAVNGRKSGEKRRGKPRSMPITWGDKISAAAQKQPIFTCEHCGKEVKGRSNLVQHQRSSKCRKLT
jgi:hypothetical protein